MADSTSTCAKWHKTDDFQRLAMAFHDEYCRFPDASKMKEAKSDLTDLVNDLVNDMKKRNVAKHIHYQGSSYEGIKTLASELEFDCLIVLEGRASTMSGLYPVGYTQLYPSGKGLSIDRMCENGYLSPQQIRNKFHSELQKSLNNLRLSGKTTLVQHGPAIQIDVYREQDKSMKWYSVDMVPGFRVDTGHIYVAKPYKPNGYGLSGVDSHLSWRRSFSAEETLKFKNIDRGNECRKRVIRMIKVICELDAPLKSLPSYMVKTVVMNLDCDPSLDWAQRCLGLRFVDVLAELRQCLSRGFLSHHFLDGSNGEEPLNLLVDSDHEVMKNMAGRLRNLLNSETKMTSMLTMTSEDAYCYYKSDDGFCSVDSFVEYPQVPESSDDDSEEPYDVCKWRTTGHTNTPDLSEVLGGGGATLMGAILGATSAAGIYVASAKQEREERNRRANSSSAIQNRGRQPAETLEPEEVLAAAGIGALAGGIAGLGLFFLSKDNHKSDK